MKDLKNKNISLLLRVLKENDIINGLQEDNKKKIDVSRHAVYDIFNVLCRSI